MRSVDVVMGRDLTHLSDISMGEMFYIGKKENVYIKTGYRSHCSLLHGNHTQISIEPNQFMCGKFPNGTVLSFTQ